MCLSLLLLHSCGRECPVNIAEVCPITGRPAERYQPVDERGAQLWYIRYGGLTCACRACIEREECEKEMGMLAESEIWLNDGCE